MKKSFAIILTAITALSAVFAAPLFGATSSESECLPLSRASAAKAALCSDSAGNDTYSDSADSEETVYPDFVSDLSIEELDCYAIGEGKFAFSQGKLIYVYAGGTLFEENEEFVYSGGSMENASADGVYAYEHNATISSMCYLSDGVLLFSDSAGRNFSYLQGTVSSYDGEIPEESSIVVNEGLAYSVIDGGMLNVTDMKEIKNFNDGVYSSVKFSNGTVYVIKDNCLCVIQGTSIETLSVKPISFTYTDVSQGERIAVGYTSTLIKEVSDVYYTTVPAGQYVTAVDLSDLSGPYFKVGEEGTFRLTENKTALIICSSGNADIIAIGDCAYITSHLSARIGWQQSEAPFTGGQLNYSASIYSLPFMCEETKLLTLETGATVHISYEIASQNGTLTADFCRVTYEDENGTITEGYIATAFLTAYDFSGENGTYEETAPEDYSEENVVLTVVLVMVIVVLVISGVAYLAYCSGANRRKNREKSEKYDK